MRRPAQLLWGKAIQPKDKVTEDLVKDPTQLANTLPRMMSNITTELSQNAQKGESVIFQDCEAPEDGDDSATAFKRRRGAWWIGRNLSECAALSRNTKETTENLICSELTSLAPFDRGVRCPSETWFGIPFTTGLQESVQREFVDPGQGFITSKNVDQDKAEPFNRGEGSSSKPRERQDHPNQGRSQPLNGQTCVYDGEQARLIRGVLNAVLWKSEETFLLNPQIRSQRAVSPAQQSVQILDGYESYVVAGRSDFLNSSSRKRLGLRSIYPALVIVDEMTGG